MKIKNIEPHIQKLSATHIYQIPDAYKGGTVDKIKYIVINVNASDLRIERRWSSNNFFLLIEELLQKYPDYKLILVGSPSEQEYVTNICAKLPVNDNVINCAGKTTIDELISLIEHAALVITNDTGPMHIAFSLGTKTIALFGPCSPKQYGNFQNTLIIYHQVYCSPCVHEFVIPPCKGNNQCMQYISISEILAGVESILTGNFDEQETLNKEIILHNKDYEDIPLGIVSKYYS